ncbi:Hypothetical protein CINCED_3A016834 [Cinara cedri]|uniref:Uncharacterized protein n=1 Tax=Cinara cedri TaxID=506608 RepID=A0A5E4NNA2_9HEMI|nr:Hypothetical protein CINCED_3A016834 [Cinara cedri]
MSINQHNYQNTITSSTSEVKNVKRCMLEHNYSKFSKRKITKRDKNVPEVTDIVEIQKPVVELKESLFVKSKANLSSIILPRKWFIELMVKDEENAKHLVQNVDLNSRRLG